MFTTVTQTAEDEEKAKKAVAKAIEAAFLRKMNARKEEEDAKEEAPKQEETIEDGVEEKPMETVPIPATRQSLKYKSVDRYN